MKLNEYQQKAMAFAKYETQDYPFLALVEEVGEAFGKLAKFNRKNGYSLSCILENIINPDDFLSDKEMELKSDLKKELGDVLWQLQACCSELGFDLEEVAQANIDKLSGRDSRGTIVGEGDER